MLFFPERARSGPLFLWDLGEVALPFCHRRRHYRHPQKRAAVPLGLSDKLRNWWRWGCLVLGWGWVICGIFALQETVRCQRC